MDIQAATAMERDQAREELARTKEKLSRAYVELTELKNTQMSADFMRARALRRNT
ncbi:hypothetical protein D3C76_1797450 [compost metagenome]